MAGVSASIRGQSESVAILLLVAVGVVLIAVIGTLALGFADRATQEPTTVAVESTADERTVTLVHQSGDSLPLEDTAVVLQSDGRPDRVPLSDTVSVTADGDGQFSAGESLTLAHAVQGELRVLVVSDNAIVHERTFDLSGATPTRLARFDRSPPANWSGNVNIGGAVTVGGGGRSVSLEGNRWAGVPFDYTVTEDTVVAFEFRSDDVGEIHAIGFETDTNQQSGRVVELAGSQNWGVPVTNGYGPSYAQGDGWTRYEVPIGEVYDSNNPGYLGDASTLLFVNDCDGCSATSAFRNVRVYERDD